MKSTDHHRKMIDEAYGKAVKDILAIIKCWHKCAKDSILCRIEKEIRPLKNRRAK